jgi:hypothetical protein
MKRVTRVATTAAAGALVSLAATVAGATAATPVIAPSLTAADPAVGKQVFPRVTVTGATDEAATFTFEIYGDAACNSQIATSEAEGTGNGTFTGAAFTAAQVGTLRVIATREATGSDVTVTSSCDTPGNSLTTTKATPKLVVRPSSAAVEVGGLVHGVAFLTEGHNLSGALDVRIHGPGDQTCSQPPVSQTSLPVSGPRDFQGAAYSPTAAGTYRVVASYSGDAINFHSLSACDDATFVATPASLAPAPLPAKAGKRGAALKKCKKVKRKKAKKRCRKKARKLPA